MHDFPAARFTFWAIGLMTVFLRPYTCFAACSPSFNRVVAFGNREPPALGDSTPVVFTLSRAGACGGSSWTQPAFWLCFGPGSLTSWRLQWGGRSVLFMRSADRARFRLGSCCRSWRRLAGWGLAGILHTKPGASVLGQSVLAKSLYVLFLNKLYFDEIYDACVVQPTIRFARWLWRRIDVLAVDRMVVGIATVSVLLARWLWRVIDCAW